MQIGRVRGSRATPRSSADIKADAPTAIYIDADADAFAWRDVAQSFFRENGYAPRPPFLGATAMIERSQFARSLLRDARASDLLVLRFGIRPLEEHWAFHVLHMLSGTGKVVAVLDAANPWAKRRLDARLAQPALIAATPEEMATLLRGAAGAKP